MRDQVAEPRASYGGQWTIEKLEILERYLDAYTSALKNTPFKLMYIDAFAGTGWIELHNEDGDATDFLSGSAKRAIEVGGKPFDRLVFVEQNPNRCTELDLLRADNLGRDVRIENSEANSFLHGLREDWRGWRGVLFLDPFATDVEWSTIETIAGFNALDTWILFPTGAIARMLPLSRKPDDISSQWTKRLTQVFGDESWQYLYQESPQGDLFGDSRDERDPGVNGLISVYKKKLKTLFDKRLLEKSRTLKNSKNSPLFEFMFCVGNPKGITLAKRIANHILEHM